MCPWLGLAINWSFNKQATGLNNSQIKLLKLPPMFRKKFHGKGRQFLGKSLCWGNGLVSPLRSSGNLGPS